MVGIVLLLLALGNGCALPEEKLPPAPEAAPVARGGTLTVGITAPAGVDPLSFHEPSGMLVGSVLCDTLVTLDPATGVVKPGLAKQWSVTDDGARIIVQLRKGASFHDGRPVRSADVVEALRRLANPENASQAADLMDGVHGLAQFRSEVEEGLPSPSLVGVRVIEPYSFEIFLSPKNPDFIRALAHPAMAPVSKAPYDADEESARAHPQCAGPYRLEAPYRPGAGEIVLKRFDRYPARNTSFTQGGAGNVDEIRFRVYPNEQAVVPAWERGEVDVAGVPATRSLDVRQRHGDRVVVGDSPAAEFIAVPHGEGSSFADARVRRALSLALDRNAVVATAYGDAHRPATGFIPPSLTTPLVVRTDKTSVKPIEYGCADAAPVTGNREEARRLLAEVRAAGGEAVERLVSTPLKLYFNDESTHRRTAEAVAAQWREALGLDVQPTPLSWDEFHRREGGAPASAGLDATGAAGTAGAAIGFDGPFRTSYTPRYSSVQAFLRPLFHSAADPRVNLARYSSGAFDIALDTDTRPVLDAQERLLQYQKLERLLCSDMPIVPVAFGRRTFRVGSRVVPARKSGDLLTREAVPNLRDMAVAP